jgi:hypothetical protein
MKKLTLFIIVILIILAIIGSILIINYIAKQKQLEECLKPTGRPVKTGLKNMDDCYYGCCLKEEQERQQCFDVCYVRN